MSHDVIRLPLPLWMSVFVYSVRPSHSLTPWCLTVEVEMLSSDVHCFLVGSSRTMGTRQKQER